MNHDVIAGLLGRGLFETVLQHFLDPGPIAEPVRRI